MNKIRFEKETLLENAKTLKLLYVENHAGTRLKLSRLLKHYFEQVFVTTYADNALKLFENGHFNLILTSSNLPDMDSLTFCKKIKDIAPKKPIVIVSKDKDPDMIINLVNVGIAGYILTPLEENKVISILSRIVLEISDLEMIYFFQDTIINEFIDNNEKEEETEPLLIQAPPSLEDEHNLLKEENIDLLLTHHDSISAQNFFDEYPVDLNITGDKLFSISEDIDMYINRFITTPSKENAFVVAQQFNEFADALEGIVEFSNISFAIKKLSMIFETLDYTKSYKENYDTILQVSDTLSRWCREIFIDKSASDIHYMDKTFLSVALMLENLFRRDLGQF